MTELDGSAEQQGQEQAETAEVPTPTTIPPEAFKQFQQALQKDLEPYLVHINEGFERAISLMKISNQVLSDENANRMRQALGGAKLEGSSASQDIMRSVVVLIHAYLEDFLRTVGRNFLPLASESTLNQIPLVGLNENGRPEKFLLGKLAQHRGKFVDDVLRESIAEHLGRTSFNNVTEIVSFLTTLGLMPEDRKQLPAIEAMIRRRHQIVHHGDRIEGKIQDIGNEVFDWVVATRAFMSTLFPSIASKKYTPQFIREKFNIEVRES